MSKPRILSIVPYKVLPAKLGGEKGITLFNEYVGAECNLVALGVEANDVSEAKNYKIFPILSNKKTRYFNPLLFFTVRKYLQKTASTFLLIEHPYYGWLAWLLKRTTNITWVVHSHNIEFQRSKSIGRWWWWLLKLYENWVYKNSDINFFISEDDRLFAENELGISKSKNHAITYGIELASIPHDIEVCREMLCKELAIDKSEKLLLFNGALYHHSNYDALRIILDVINPRLIEAGLKYKIVVCGKGLPASFDDLNAYKEKNVIYRGFVEDISVYFKAADMFLNPILTGGGVKTKAIEAIAYNCTVISTEIGALGLNRKTCENKLFIVADNDWEGFLTALIQNFENCTDTPPAFYDFYYWGKIASKVSSILSEAGRTS